MGLRRITVGLELYQVKSWSLKNLQGSSTAFPMSRCISVVPKNHAVVAEASRSWSGFASIMHQNRSRKFDGLVMRPGALTLAICQTAATKSQPQNVWPAISTPPHKSHSTSTGISRSLSLVLVGRMSVQARQIKFLILFGQWNFQIDFYNDFILVLFEHSLTLNLDSCLWLTW